VLAEKLRSTLAETHLGNEFREEPTSD